MSAAFFRSLTFRKAFGEVTNPEVLNQVYDRMKLRKRFSKAKNLQIWNLYSGTSIASVTLQDYLKPKRQILMDPSPKVQKVQSALQDKGLGGNFEYIVKDPYVWESFTDMIADGTLKLEKQGVDKLSTEFFYVANYTNSLGEGLAVQHLNCIANRNWVYRYGRVRSLAIMRTKSAIKFCKCKSGKNVGSRMSFKTEMFSDAEIVALTEDSVDLINQEYMDEKKPIIISQKDVSGDVKSSSLAIMDFKPKYVDASIDLDYLDYVTKHLFLQSSKPLETCIENLGSGAKDFFMSEPEFLAMKDQSPGELSENDFVVLTKLFGYWPFKPDILLDFESNEHGGTSQRR